MDKGEYTVNSQAHPSSPVYRDDRIASIAQEKGVERAEAAENFGNIETAEEYGYVARG